jgi:DNA-binding NtrC family response regulator
VLLSDQLVLEPPALGEARVPTMTAAEAPALDTRLTLAEAERRHIEAVLRAEKGVVPRAAQVLGLSRSALYERLKKHGLAVRKPAEE